MRLRQPVCLSVVAVAQPPLSIQKSGAKLNLGASQALSAQYKEEMACLLLSRRFRHESRQYFPFCPHLVAMEGEWIRKCHNHIRDGGVELRLLPGNRGEGQNAIFWAKITPPKAEFSHIGWARHLACLFPGSWYCIGPAECMYMWPLTATLLCVIGGGKSVVNARCAISRAAWFSFSNAKCPRGIGSRGMFCHDPFQNR